MNSCYDLLNLLSKAVFKTVIRRQYFDDGNINGEGSDYCERS